MRSSEIIGYHHFAIRKKKDMFLYSAVSSPLDRSKLFTLFLPLTDLFIPTQTRLLQEAFKPCSNYAHRLNTHISTTVYSQVPIYTVKSTGASMERTKKPKLRNSSKGDSNPGSHDCESGILPLSYHTPVCATVSHPNYNR